jgi:hypothetical protein
MSQDNMVHPGSRRHHENKEKTFISWKGGKKILEDLDH